MRDSLSTREVGWVLGRSPESIRDAIRRGEIDGTRIPQGFRIARPEVLRLARAKLEDEGARRLADGALERLIDDVLATNESGSGDR
jgi:hypothetical protein